MKSVYKYLHTDGAYFEIFDDGSVRLIPPPKFIAELSHFVVTGKISHAASRIVFDTWRNEMLERLTAGLTELCPPPSPA